MIWENGLNRIFDPRFLKTDEENNIVLFDKWEFFSVNFSMYYPTSDDDEVLCINGDTLQLGNWNKVDKYFEMILGP